MAVAPRQPWGWHSTIASTRREVRSGYRGQGGAERAPAQWLHMGRGAGPPCHLDFTRTFRTSRAERQGQGLS